MFRPFEKGAGPVDSQGTDKSGAGLGLSMVRNFIQLHGGTVDVKSPPGRGTTIICRLPAAGPAGEDG